MTSKSLPPMSAVDSLSTSGRIPEERRLETAQDGMWDWNLTTGRVAFSAEWCAMLGYRSDDVTPHVSSWDDAVHPDDWPVIRASLDLHLRGETPLHQCEHRLRCSDGSWRWVLAQGKVTERATDGKALRMLGTNIGITSRSAVDASTRRTHSINAAQLHMLQQLMQGASADQLLAEIANAVERIAPEILVAVLTASTDGTVLRYRHVPSLAGPVTRMAQIPITAEARGCGLAAFTRARVVVDEIASDEHREPSGQLPELRGIRACTSVPLVGENADLLGVIDFYNREVGPSAPEHATLFEFAVHAATLVLRRERVEEERLQREADQRFLYELSAELQRTQSLRERGGLAVRRLAEHLMLPVAGWSIVDKDARTVTVQDFFEGGAVAYRGDVVPADAWPTLTAADDLLVFEDAQDDPLYGSRYAATFQQVGWRSSLAYGLFRGGTWVGVTYVSDVVPRRWTEREQRVMRFASEQIWSALDVARALHELASEHQRLEAVLAALPVGVVLTDVSGAFQMVNPRAVEIWGGAPFANSVVEYELYRAWRADSGAPIAPEEWALARALSKGEISAGEMIRIARFDGEERTIVNSAGPIVDHSGTITGAVAVVDDITEQARLISANEQLAEASRRKSAFVSYLSHELRTPLNAIMGFSELLHDEVLGPVSDLQREVLVDMRSSGKHLMGVLDDILDTSRIEAGHLDLKKTPIPLHALIDDVMVPMRRLADDHRVHLEAQVAPDAHDAPFVADAVRVRQVVFNYLTNAIKYTGPGGRVELRVHRAADMLRFSVIDTGIGIAPENQSRLFLDFETVEGTSGSGWGLGLALTRRLVEAHCGRVGLKSALGVGSTFWAEFPL